MRTRENRETRIKEGICEFAGIFANRARLFVASNATINASERFTVRDESAREIGCKEAACKARTHISRETRVGLSRASPCHRETSVYPYFISPLAFLEPAGEKTSDSPTNHVRESPLRFRASDRSFDGVSESLDRDSVQ